MKRRSNENPVSEVIDLFLKQYGLNNRYKEFRLLQSWNELMGPMIAKHTKDVKMFNGILYVDLDSAPMRNELSFAKTRIIKNLNEEAGEEIVKEMVFR
jgi:predicted nucleic acid-binding Zn ribbon protein